MGNQMCCEDGKYESKLQTLQVQLSNSKTKDNDKVEQHKSITYISKIEQQNEQDEISQPQPTIQTPQISPNIKLLLYKDQFYQKQFQNIKKVHSKRYGNDTYEGQLDDDKKKPNGFGRMYKQEGNVYVGHFNNGYAQGLGSYIYKNGSYYRGPFVKNKAEGENGQYYSINLRYQGGFKNNTFHGSGHQQGEDHQFEGHYDNGVRTSGVFKWGVKDKTYLYQYQGKFNNKNQFHGKGILKEPQGQYEGDFVNGKKEGEGHYKAANGTKYRGQYYNDYRHGKGIIFNKDDSISYEGELKNGLPDGKGYVINEQTGQKTERIWTQGIDTTNQ